MQVFNTGWHFLLTILIIHYLWAYIFIPFQSGNWRVGVYKTLEVDVVALFDVIGMESVSQSKYQLGSI